MIGPRCVCGIDEADCLWQQRRAQCADPCLDRQQARLEAEGVHCAWCDRLILHEDGYAPDESEGELICEACNDRCERLRERGITVCPDCGDPTHASESDDTGRCAGCRANTTTTESTMTTIYRVNWDNGASACGTFPHVFDTHEDAEAFGNDWANECNMRDFGTTEPDGDCYTFDVIEQEVPDDEEMEIDDGGRKAGLNRGQP